MENNKLETIKSFLKERYYDIEAETQDSIRFSNFGSIIEVYPDETVRYYIDMEGVNIINSKDEIEDLMTMFDELEFDAEELAEEFGLNIIY